MTVEFTPVNKTAAWARLAAHRQAGVVNLRQAFASDPHRADTLSVRTEHMYYDYSRQLVTGETMKLLFDLARERDLEGKLKAMYQGEKINVTEDRAVGHVALRDLSDTPFVVDGHDYKPDIKAVLKQIEKFSYLVINGRRIGYTDKRFKNILAIGIGGSYLGPEFLAEACARNSVLGMNLRFVANVDGADFAKKTEDLDPEETLVVVISKTFTTAETMKNAQSAKKWMQNAMGSDAEVIRKHFVAVSTAKDKVEAFGIDPGNMFAFWDFVGGRYSSSSAVGGVPLSLYLEYDNFTRMLAGANRMDQYLINTPLENNFLAIMALLDIWNINFLGYKTRSLLPYFQRLAKLPPHTQQVEMESNGKRVDILGREIEFDTGEVVFGEPGTNGQHSFYNLLHLGTQIIPCDFIGFIQPQYPLGQFSADEVTHHQELMDNFFAQPDALAFGQKDANPHRFFPGNRPSSSWLLKELNPFTAGMLLAITEHRAALKGLLWGINPFDQFGVELGKKLGVDIRSRMLGLSAKGKLNLEGLNPSTALMLESFMRNQLPK